MKSGKKLESPTAATVDREIQAVRREISPHQLEIFGHMSFAEAGQRLSDMIAAMRQVVFATERAANPDLSDIEIHKRALARFMRFSEWDPDVREGFIKHMDRVLPKYYAAKNAEEAAPENDLP